MIVIDRIHMQHKRSSRVNGLINTVRSRHLVFNFNVPLIILINDMQQDLSTNYYSSKILIIR